MYQIFLKLVFFYLLTFHKPCRLSLSRLFSPVGRNRLLLSSLTCISACSALTPAFFLVGVLVREPVRDREALLGVEGLLRHGRDRSVAPAAVESHAASSNVSSSSSSLKIGCFMLFSGQAADPGFESVKSSGKPRGVSISLLGVCIGSSALSGCTQW